MLAAYCETNRRTPPRNWIRSYPPLGPLRCAALVARRGIIDTGRRAPSMRVRCLGSDCHNRTKCAQMRDPLNRGTSQRRARDPSRRPERRRIGQTADFTGIKKQAAKPRKRNAITHWIYGKDIVLPWESREKFEKILAELQEEWQPSGRMENEAVFDLAHFHWQKYRVRQMWVAAAYADPFTSDLVKSGRKSWAAIRDHLES